MPTDYLMNTEVRESLLILLNITLKPDNNIFGRFRLYLLLRLRYAPS